MKMTKTTSKFQLAVYLEDRKIVGFGINDTQRRLSAYPPKAARRMVASGIYRDQKPATFNVNIHMPVHASDPRRFGWHRHAPQSKTKGVVQHFYPVHKRAAAKAAQPYNSSVMQSYHLSPILPRRTESEQAFHVTSQMRQKQQPLVSG